MASAFGLPNTGYIAFAEVAAKVQEMARAVTMPIVMDGDTGHGNPMNVKRTAEGFAIAGTVRVIIQDQTRPKRCGHTKEKAIVQRDEAYARIQTAADALMESHDI